MNKEIEAVVFDMDGVIVDSMHDHARTWIKSLSEHSINCTENDIFIREGYSSKRIIDELADREVSQKEIQEISDLRHSYLKEEDIELFDWIPELIENLSGDIKIGIVTGSSRREVEHLIPNSLLEKVSVVVTEDDYEKGKPDPEPFLQSVEKLGISKENVLVVENAPAGVKSAKNAGLKVLGIPTYVDAKDIKKADLVVKDHDELSSFLLNS